MKTIKLRVFRYDPSVDKAPRYETYEVPGDKKMWVLDALIHIRENYDSSLAFRYSCRHPKKCGSCGILINDEPKLACMTLATDGMTVEPMSRFPVVRDLVVDTSEFEKRLAALRPFLERVKEPEKAPEFFPSTKYFKQQDYFDLSSCIECYLCVNACPLVTERPAFIGPAGMATLARYSIDPRDEGDKARRAYLEGLYWGCTTCSKCKEICPQQIAIPEIVIERTRALCVKEGVGPLPAHVELMRKAVETGKIIDKITTPLLEQVPEVVRVKDPVARVIFFTGCLMDYRLQEVGKACIDILKANRVEVHIPHEQVCCGSVLVRTGQVEPLYKLVEKNVELFKKTRTNIVLTGCPGCGITIRYDWPAIYEETMGEKLELRHMDITEFLVKEIKLDVERVSSPVKFKVTYHDPCHLRRRLGVYEEPREILRSIPGVELVEMTKPDLCCGAGGGLRAGYRNLSYQVGYRKVKMIEQTGADILSTICPFCQLQFLDLVNQGKMKEISVKSVMELLKEAYKQGDVGHT